VKTLADWFRDARQRGTSSWLSARFKLDGAVELEYGVDADLPHALRHRTAPLTDSDFALVFAAAQLTLDCDVSTLSEVAGEIKGLGRLELGTIVEPETRLPWHRGLIAQKYDGSKRALAGRGRLRRSRLWSCAWRTRIAPGDIGESGAHWQTWDMMSVVGRSPICWLGISSLSEHDRGDREHGGEVETCLHPSQKISWMRE
jgi:hypothetical protein